MDSHDHRRTVSALAKLLRDELREARFSVSRLTHAHAEIRLDQSTTTALEPTYEKVLDADGLRSFHDGGAWKRDLFRFEIQVQPLLGGAESCARRTRFEHLLDHLGVLSDGHVAHGLGPLVFGSTHRTVAHDSPHAVIGFAEAAELWRYLLIDACLDTPRRTATKVLRWVRGAPLSFETRVLLGRLDAADRFSLASGLAVEPLPRTSRVLEHWIPIGIGIAPSDFLGRTMLRIPCTITPVLSKPSGAPDRGRGRPTERWKASRDVESTWRLPLGGIYELTRALSLACDVAVETPMIWTDYGHHAHFGQRHGVSNMGAGEPTPRSASGSPLTADSLKEALRLQPHLYIAPPDVQRAIRYWLKSKARRADVPDGLVFLRTALEALFLDASNRTELTFRLATNGAWYTGRSRVERRACYEVLKKVYGAASGAVHAGRVKGDADELLEEGQKICRQAILKRVRSKQAPVWPDIVFGR